MADPGAELQHIRDTLAVVLWRHPEWIENVTLRRRSPGPTGVVACLRIVASGAVYTASGEYVCNVRDLAANDWELVP